MAKNGEHRGGRKVAQATLKAQVMRAHLVDRVEKELDPILDSQIDLSKGITVMITREKVSKDGKLKRIGKWYQVSDPIELKNLMNEEDPDGENYYKIYTKLPSEKAASYLLDQAMGKATQTLETPGLTESIVELVQRLNDNK